MSTIPPSLLEIRDALLTGGARIAVVQTFGNGLAVQVMKGSKKIGPLLFPGEGKGLPDLLALLGSVLEEGQ